MKKTLVIMLALFLAIPAISYAGAVNSRWDMSIGGNIKFDVGWTDQSGGMSSALWAAGNPDRNPTAGNAQVYDKYGTQMWGAGETGLNFFVKGPDAWGAHTHAFILADFTGVWGSAQGQPPTNYNTFNLLIAEMAFDWENTTLAMGTNSSFFGMVPTFANSASWNFAGYGGKGAAPVAPQITVVERFTKNWNAGLGVMSPYNQVNELVSPAGNSSPTADIFRNPLPAFEGKIAYTSDSCGKVGPWQLLAEMDGFYGQIRHIYGSTGIGGDISKKDVDEWFVDFKLLVPVIPEKNGNKASALYFDGEIFWEQGAGQGGSWLANGGTPWLTDDYQRATTGDFHAATAWGVVGHGQFYFTDAVSFNAFYLYTTVDASQALKLMNPMDIKSGYQWAANLMYDVNPAVRFTLEWDYSNLNYAAAATGFKSNGSQNVYRLAAYYFF
ncbi:MAG: hypothetical protein ABSH25_06040 [Syntrophorhabdales bacterium]|jgi:hypothetical protein